MPGLLVCKHRQATWVAWYFHRPLICGGITKPGRRLARSFYRPLTCGGITWAGRRLARSFYRPLTCGGITWAGRRLARSFYRPLTCGSIDWAGNSFLPGDACCSSSVDFSQPVQSVTHWTGDLEKEEGKI
ncbi:hypothetical protein MTO96_037717 [Rhipicephalus appendiculatus]